VTRDLAIAGVIALALHGLILSFPLAGSSNPAHLLIHKPIALSIVRPRAPVATAAPALTSPASPAPPSHEDPFETRKQDSRETTVMPGKAVTSVKSSTKIDTPGTKKISKEIASPEASRPLRDETELVKKENSAPAGTAETFVVPGAQADEQEGVVSARPRYEENPPPPYPRVARRRGYEGGTLLRVEVLETGNVGGIEIATSSGFDVLDEAAVRAVKDWHFVPATKNGKRVRQWVVVPIRFSLK